MLHYSLISLALASQQALPPKILESIKEELFSREATLDNIYTEYDVYRRRIVVTEAIPKDAGIEITDLLEEPNGRFCWSKQGNYIYWELFEFSPDGSYSHQAAWTEGEDWLTLEVSSSDATKGDIAPLRYFLNPTSYYTGVGKKPWSALFAESDCIIGALDSRWDKGDNIGNHYRLELPHLDYPTSRLAITVDISRQSVPRRVYKMYEDLLYADWEGREFTTTDRGAYLPSRYRLMLFRHDYRNHFIWTSSLHEYEMVLTDVSYDQSTLGAVRRAYLEPGTSIYNAYTQRTSIVASAQQEALTAWLRTRSKHKSADEWWWEAQDKLRGIGAITIEEISDASCGVIALEALAEVMGKEAHERGGPEDDLGAMGHSRTLEQMIQSGYSYGLSLASVRVDPNDLARMHFPMIALLKKDPHGHYVALDYRDGHHILLDYPNRMYTVHSLSDMPNWTGIALVPGAAASQLLGEPRRRTAAILAAVGAVLLGVGVSLRARSRFLRRSLDAESISQ